MAKETVESACFAAPSAMAGQMMSDFRVLAELSPDLIVRVDSCNCVSYVNPSHHRHTGIAPSAVIGKPLSNLGFPPATLALCEACLAETFDQRRETHWEFEYAPPLGDGRVLHFHARCLPEPDAKGTVHTVLMVLQNATIQHQTEQKLGESEQRYRSLFERNPDGVFAVDSLGRFIMANPACATLTGYSVEELLNKTFVELCTPENLPATAQSIQAALGGSPAENIRVTIVRKDARRVELLVIGGPVVIDGKVVAMHCAAKDITLLQQAEARERSARAQAESAIAAKDRFLAVLSHELRTPLSPIVITAHLLESNTAFPAEVRDAAATIRRNAELEARIVDDLLDLTRISRGKVHLHQAPTDMHEQIRRVAGRCQSDLRAQKLTFTLRLDAHHSFVHGDSTRLQQVLWNLLKNALKFTPSGGRITLSTENDDKGCLLIHVADTGIGIKPEMLTHLFDPFEQGDAEVTRLFGGLGLGLSIARSLADLHGGSITAASDGPGHGSTFTLCLPVLHDFDGAPDPGQGGPADEPRGRTLRVLLVEDHRDTIRTMTRLLDSHGHTVRTADCLAVALRVAAAETFDLLISDIGLPDGSGLDLMRQLHTQYALKGIALSGFGTEDDVRKSKEAGFAAHLTKPVNLKELEKVIRRTVG